MPEAGTITTEFFTCPLCGGHREASERKFADGDWVIDRSGERGKVVNYWVEPGPLHCYTLRLTNRLKDFIEDELELA